MPKSNAPERQSTPRAVVDTNLFVRGLLKGPATMPLIEAWKDGQFILVTSEELLAELFGVLARPEFRRHFTREDIGELGRLIYERAEMVKPSVHGILCREIGEPERGSLLLRASNRIENPFQTNPEPSWIANLLKEAGVGQPLVRWPTPEELHRPEALRIMRGR